MALAWSRNLWLAHHPLCGRFDDHLFRVRGRPACLGCFTVYPSAAAMLILALLTPVLSWAGEVEYALLAAGLFLMSLVRLVRLEGLRWKLLPRVCMGLALGSFILLNLHIADSWHRAAAWLAFLGALAALIGYKASRFLKPCETCPYLSRRPACPGFVPGSGPPPPPEPGADRMVK